MHLALAKRFPSYNITAQVATLRPGPLADIARSSGIVAHAYNEDFRWRDIAAIQKCIAWLTELIREEKIDILHANHMSHCVGGFAARRARVPEIWHHHDYPYGFEITDRINRMIPTDAVIFTTHKVCSGYPDLQRKPHAVIYPNCVDYQALRELDRDVAVRERLQLGEAPFFLTVTRMQPHKGHVYLLDAVQQTAATYPAVRWVIAGKARGKEQEEYLAQLKQKVASLKIEDKVVFAGFVSDAELAYLRASAMALVHPALSEGYGLVLLEAMAFGTPVIAAAADGPSEMVTDEKNGLLVPTADSTALANAMKRLLDAPEFARQLGISGQQLTEQRSLETMVQETAALYRQTRERFAKIR